jgi:hypothetical protein
VLGLRQCSGMSPDDERSDVATAALRCPGLPWRPADYDWGVELRSSHELLVWLGEVSASGRSGATTRGEYLLTLAIGEGKIAQPPNLFADWLYELRDGGSIVFDDSDVTAARSPDGELSRKDVFLIRNIGLTRAGRTSLKSLRPR